MQERIRQEKGRLQLQQKVRKKMKGRKIRIRQGIKGWLLALAMVLSLCSGWKQDVCAQQSQSSSSNLMQDVDTDKKGSIEILFDTMRDEPVANAEFTLYQVAAMVDRGGYTVLELTGGFEGCGVQLKNLTAQQSKDASAALWSIREQITFPGIRKEQMQTERSAGQGCRPVCICWFRVRCRNTEPIRLWFRSRRI